jgi:hypothetical protein
MDGHQIRRLVSALSFATYLIAALALPASASAPPVAGAIPAPHAGPVTAVAKITGSGTAQMGASFFGNFYGTTLWWENERGITLYSDGSAKGTFYCVDLPDSTPMLPGIVWGAVKSWTLDGGLISLHVPASLGLSWSASWHWGLHHEFPPVIPSDAGTWRIQIQRFGGAGVGHWTLDVPDGSGGWLSFCVEQVTGGKIALKLLPGHGEDD